MGSLRAQQYWSVLDDPPISTSPPLTANPAAEISTNIPRLNFGPPTAPAMPTDPPVMVRYDAAAGRYTTAPAATDTQWAMNRMRELENQRLTIDRQLENLRTQHAATIEAARVQEVIRKRAEYTELLARGGTTSTRTEYYNGEESYTTSADPETLERWLSRFGPTVTIQWEDCGLYAMWQETTPLTLAQREEAEAYLRDNPEPEAVAATPASPSPHVLDSASIARQALGVMTPAQQYMQDFLNTYRAGRTISFRPPSIPNSDWT